MTLHRLLLAAALSAGLVAAGHVQAQSVTVTRADGDAQVVDAARLSGLPRATAAVTVHGRPHVFEGPLLMDVLKAAGAAPDRPPHGPELARAVVVRAADGYGVVFGLAELDPSTRAGPVVLADRMDGEAITGADGPLRLAVEGDLRPAR